MLVSLIKSGTPRWPLHTLLLKISNTRSPLTIEGNALALALALTILTSLRFQKHFGVKSYFEMLLNFDMT